MERDDVVNPKHLGRSTVETGTAGHDCANVRDGDAARRTVFPCSLVRMGGSLVFALQWSQMIPMLSLPSVEVEACSIRITTSL